MIKKINNSLKPKREQLLNHSLHPKVHSPQQLRIFMEHHVFAVWDFMSLLTELQEKLTKTSQPWFPVGDPEIRYLIHEIILAKDTDVNLEGKHQSHFEMYLEAMSSAGADTRKIEDFLLQVNHGTDIFLIIAASKIPISIKQFLKNTFDVISEGKPHNIAAAFAFGREGLIPKKFSSIIENIQKNFPENDLKLFKYYLDKQIQLKENDYSSKAFQMVEKLCGNDPEKWEEAKKTAENALSSRIELWNGIEEVISEKTDSENLQRV